MNSSEKEYIRQIVKESAEVDRMINEALSYADSALITENTAADVTSTVIWSIIDILMVLVPGGVALSRTAKGLVKTGSKGIKQAIRLFRQNSKITRKAIKKSKKGILKASKNAGKGSLCMIAASLLSLFEGFDTGEPWTGKQIGQREKLPLVGTENLDNRNKNTRNVVGGTARTIGMFFEPLNAIGEYTDKLRNAARKLSNKVLAQTQQEMNEAIAQTGKGALGRLWAKVTGTLKNVFLNGETSTDNVYTKGFFQMCRDRGIDTTEIAAIMGASYKDLITKSYGKQLSPEELNSLIRKNIINASQWFTLSSTAMLNGAQLQAGAGVKPGAGIQPRAQTQVSGAQTNQTAANQTIAQFQQWSQSMFTDPNGQPLVPDGKVGPKTRYVIQQFQEWANQNNYSQNMPVDGRWGPLTADAFNKALQAQTRQTQDQQTQQIQNQQTQQTQGQQTQEKMVAEECQRDIDKMLCLMERIEFI